jgi:mannose-6-phosphate isomerase-like protein (cupin superfamily)
MKYLRLLDQEALDSTVGRYGQTFVESEPGISNCSVTYTRSDVGSDAPRAPLHDHPFDQLFFVISGTMTIEIEGEQLFDAGPNSMVIYPKGVMHRNFNQGTEPTVHLSINLLA